MKHSKAKHAKAMRFSKPNWSKTGVIRLILLCVFGCSFLVAAYKLMGIHNAYKAGSDVYDQIQFEVVDENEMAETGPDQEAESVTTEPEVMINQEKAPVSVDFDALQEINPDVVGWIYSPGTPINYPIVQGKDNDEYLRHTIRREYNIAGSIFMDYRNEPDFSTVFNVIYGHNLYTQEMFGSLLNYKKDGYYEDHSVMWLLTPNGDYKLHVIAGFTLKASSSLYEFGMTEEGIGNFLAQALEKNDFTPPADDAPVENFLVMSTCSYEYDDARYIVVTRMEPLDF
ncbi:MAG: class B sortase [Clostridia bacterium]|nr:class B sortase [Clostridia bacterium]